MNKCTHQVFGHILRLHPAGDVGDGVENVVGHDIDLREDGLKFWLMSDNRKIHKYKHSYQSGTYMHKLNKSEV